MALFETENKFKAAVEVASIVILLKAVNILVQVTRIVVVSRQ